MCKSVSWWQPLPYSLTFSCTTMFKEVSLLPCVPVHTLVFCMKFNYQQLLFDVVFDIIHIFGSVHPRSESFFLVSVHYTILNMEIFRAS